MQKRSDVSFGLVTGNLEPIGWGKMKALGIQHLFSQPLWGGFGSDFCSGDTGEPWRDRGEMVRLARQRWLRQQGQGVSSISVQVRWACAAGKATTVREAPTGTLIAFQYSIALVNSEATRWTEGV